MNKKDTFALEQTYTKVQEGFSAATKAQFTQQGSVNQPINPQGLTTKEQSIVFGGLKENLVPAIQDIVYSLLGGNSPEEVNDDEFTTKYDQVVNFIKRSL